MNGLNLYDVVALTEDIPEEKLHEGQVGTIVEVYERGKAFEVDFVNQADGHTYALLTLRPEQVMQLHYGPVLAAA
ncbi:MAG: DUF4926 domain-containing protein [Pyrinomonadaceae bacterium]